MKQLPEKAEGPARTADRVDGIFSKLIQCIDGTIREGVLEIDDLVLLALGGLAAALKEGDKPRVAQKIRLASDQIRLLKELLKARDEQAMQRTLSDRMNAIEIQLSQKNNPAGRGASGKGR